MARVHNWLMLITAIVAICSPCVKGKDDQSLREDRIFAFYSTTSVTRLTTTTITDFTTCFSTANEAAQGACQGRKKRFIPSVIDTQLMPEESDDLSGSFDEDPQAEYLVKREALSPSVVVREGKKLTIWSTNYTTITITSTSILGMTTVSASALCTFPNQAQLCFAGK